MMIRNANDIGALIRDRRSKVGWDQQTLADRVGVSRLWVNEVERGKPGAGLGRVLNTLAALGVELQSRQPGDDGIDAKDLTSADLIARMLARGQDG